MEKQEEIKYYQIAYKELIRFTNEAFLRMGFEPEQADIATQNLIRADVRGIDSHGIARLNGYIRLVKNNRINPKAKTFIEHESPSTATLNGDKGVGLVVGDVAMKLAIEKAKTAGTGWVAVNNSNHFGIAANYAMMALEQDMIGIAMTNASALVAPTFSKSKMLGTNPICYAFPSGSEAPFIADFATTTAANGKLEILQRENLNTPDGWVQDETGNPSTDAHILKKGGALLPLGGDKTHGGHKGFALGSIVDILTGVLSGASFGPWVPPFPAYVPMPENMPGEGIGHFFGAMRIDAFQPAATFKSRMDLWLKTFRNASAIENKHQPLVPGDIERTFTQQRIKQGVPIIENVYQDILQLADELKIAPVKTN